MMVIGVTGRRSSGKSTFSRMIARRSGDIFDADGVCRELYEEDEELIGRIGERFPGSVREGRVERLALSSYLMTKVDIEDLEGIVHGRVREEMGKFLRSRRRGVCGYVVLDVPLLFEGGFERICDKVVWVKTTGYVERMRVSSRELAQDRAGVAKVLLERRMKDREHECDKVLITGLSRGSVRVMWEGWKSEWGLA